MTRPVRERRLTDRSGIVYITPHAHVKITHPRHAYHGRTGTVVRWDTEKRRVWVALSGNVITSMGSRSLEVLP